MFQGTGDQIVFVRNTQTTPPSSGSSSGGLTTAAIVGIVVGGVVALCAVAVREFEGGRVGFVGCRFCSQMSAAAS